MIVLNGSSSAGKSGIARCLQAVLPDPWLAIGVDTLIDTLPAAMREGGLGIGFGDDGEVTVGADFRDLERAWNTGVGAMARAGARIVVDDVFLGGAASQARLRDTLEGLDVLWVGVHCDPEVLDAREIARGDRAPGMAAAQHPLVHRGVTYDVEVDTTRTEALDCARTIAARVTGPAVTG
ncbi:chloramphenicol phosphotransferase CPT [Streptomyces sp. NPDC101118]|uniref:chloramphenicol phosphotransferase CPT n=1 Tax=Streptomyces sp. NPDC101118 TaxID=3366109 RepID=UPI00382987C3